MIIKFHKFFEKKYKKLSSSLKRKADQKLEFFLDNPFEETLNNHALKGKYLGYRSINLTGDLRMIYKNISPDIALFSNIDNHGNLFK